MKILCARHALVSWIIAASVSFSACGRGPWDINNEIDRLAMVQETKNALTAFNCATALDLSTNLFQSIYTDNNIRMLYASSHACNIGISLFTLIDDIAASDFTTQDSIFKTLVRLFPSKSATDTKFESAVYAQDALQSVLPAGAVVSANNTTYSGSHNPGSVLARDRVEDANMYMSFTSMALVGTALNRYGYTAAQDPASLAYAQQVSLATTWPNSNAIKIDASGAGCSIASGMLNMLDGIDVLSTRAPGATATALSLIVSNLSAATTAAANAQCTVQGFSAAVCAAALVRLRYRGSCTEVPDAMAASALGILLMIDSGWN